MRRNAVRWSGIADREGNAGSYSAAAVVGFFALCCAFCVLGLGCSDPAKPCPALQVPSKVVRALDGDTILIESGDKVRYIGVDAPENGECFYEEAARYHGELVDGREIRLEFDVRLVDPYGRLLAYAYVGTLFVNAALVREGCCRAAAYPPNTKHRELFEALEAEAREESRGMWGQCDGQ